MIKRVRFVVYGAGAIGGILGARLHERDHDVTLVARGAHYEAIRDGGLRLLAPGDVLTTYDIPVVDKIEDAEIADDATVFLAMKSQDTELAVRDLAAYAPPTINVVCVQNGVDNERTALRRFQHVYGVCVMCPAVHLEPGLVEASSAPLFGTLDLGRYPSGTDEHAVAISGAIADAGYLSEPRPDIMAWKYAKLLGNLNNCLAALSGPEAAQSEAGKLVRDEAERVLRAAGVDYVPFEGFRARWANLTRLLSANRSNSSWQSLQRGTGSIEADFLNGEIVLIARMHGLDAPMNALVQRMALELAREGGAPGSVSTESVLAALTAVA